MTTNNDFDTSFAKTISQIMATSLSSYSASPDSLLGNINVIPFKFGKQHITRPISDPYDDVMVDRRFNAPEQEASKLVQDIDFINISKRLRIDRVDYMADPQNVANHVRDFMAIFKSGIEKVWVEGTSAKTIMYGLEDYPSGTTGTINRPEMAGYTTDGAADGWSVSANLINTLIVAEETLIGKKFYGPKALLCPSICKPMLTNLVASGVDKSTKAWIESTIGNRIIFSPFVHEAAVATDFNVYMIDLSKIHFGLTDLKVDSFYSNEKHAYFVDFEIYMAFLADPLFDGTDYMKGVYKLDAREWIETT